MESSIKNEEKPNPLPMEQANGYRHETLLSVLDKFFHCDICHRRYRQRKSLARHCKSHLETKPYSCYYCDKPFIEHYQLLRHANVHKWENDFSEKLRLMQSMKKIATTDNLFSAIRSPFSESFLSSSNNSNSNNSNDKLFPCPECGKLFNRKNNVTRHIKIHKKNTTDYVSKKSGDFNCTLCDRVFQQQHYLQQHLEYDHRTIVETSKNDEEIVTKNLSTAIFQNNNNNNNNNNNEWKFVCEICKKPFARKDTLARHELLHSDRRPFACDKCDKTFRIKEHLSRHYKRHEKDLKPFMCKHCSRHFDGKSAFVMHFEEHAVDKISRCKICQRNFDNHSNMIRHLENEHVNANCYVCAYCYERYSNKYFLTKHVKSHVNRTDFLCRHCNKYFILENHLVDHMKMDQDERPFVCTFCSKRFKQNTHLTSHMKSHSDDRPFACQRCGRRFLRRFQLKRHFKAVHLRVSPHDDNAANIIKEELLLTEEQRVALYPICTVNTICATENIQNDDDEILNEQDDLLRITLDYLLKQNQTSTNRIEKFDASYLINRAKQQHQVEDDSVYREHVNCFAFKDNVDDLAQQIVSCISTHFMCL